MEGDTKSYIRELGREGVGWIVLTWYRLQQWDFVFRMVDLEILQEQFTFGDASHL
jgi:hypothetical protein